MDSYNRKTKTYRKKKGGANSIEQIKDSIKAFYLF